ncbi:hypothetical protein PP182_09920 [Maribacter sp. PR1]|uniref:Uncharacterized protein n=1 Tax=Maribacter cobaltidurans TaxID=1178778 RepID=A0ABU7ITS8_9FLAO|nr:MULTISPECIES: hypothetical protein [Maribacter]MDC6388997.1 hypothetical protein [Maribacter sp. PR1]MEE1976385.1 hypothetical protein [Maribacter cobaltidurans]
MRKENQDKNFSVRQDIETRLHQLNLWKSEIQIGFDDIITRNPLDEIKDLLVYIDESIARNEKLMISLFLDRSADFEHHQSNRLNALMLASIDNLNENAEKEAENIKKAISHVTFYGGIPSTPFFKKVI